MTRFSCTTIAKPAEGEYRQKGSTFLSFAYPVSSETAIKEHLSALEKQYFDARHHCFAWMLGVDRKTYRISDDGEPSHSAGDPILGQIRSRNLTNILVVVVRYFGGVKLGVGGLIAAYKRAAEDALDHAQVIEQEITDGIVVTYGYEATPQVMRLVKEFDLKIQSQTFEAECSLVATFTLRQREKLLDKLSLMAVKGIRVRYHDLSS